MVGLSEEFKEKWLNRLIIAVICFALGWFIIHEPKAWTYILKIIDAAGDAVSYIAKKFGIKL